MDISKLEHWHFDLNEASANALLQLVLEGKKRATSSSLRGYQVENEPLPKVGDMSVITDWDGNDGCVIRTTSVEIYRFGDMTFDIVKEEGEDECLETWREKHIRFFTEEGKEVGYTFDEDMPVVFERFEIVQ